jgi:hypothetical protein
MNAPAKAPPAEQADWARYAQLKQDWIAQHPDATPAEFEAAIAAIAEECGV